MYDVPQEQYPTVIRAMIQHEDELTNHRMMWLLVGQGFLANAYVSVVKSAVASTYVMLSLVGLLVALSAFLMLFRSYQARGYLQFLGEQAKQGTLPEGYLPLTGWPRNRIKDWWINVWICPWIRQPRDLFEPWLLLPWFFTSVWILSLLRFWSILDLFVVSILSVILATVILFISCIVLVWLQGKDEQAPERLREHSEAKNLNIER
jgi:hypothetical protein